MMTALEGPAKSPLFYLAGAGLVMVIALATSKKARNVIKTSVDLSRQTKVTKCSAVRKSHGCW